MTKMFFSSEKAYGEKQNSNISSISVFFIAGPPLSAKQTARYLRNAFAL
jgi:hypothetical protein